MPTRVPWCSSPCTQFCGKGSLTDVLKSGKSSPAKAAQLSWTRRLNMVCVWPARRLA